MEELHRFFWNKENEHENYMTLLEVAYNFGKEHTNEDVVAKLGFRKGRDDDPLDYSIIYAKLIQKVSY